MNNEFSVSIFPTTTIDDLYNVIETIQPNYKPIWVKINFQGVDHETDYTDVYFSNTDPQFNRSQVESTINIYRNFLSKHGLTPPSISNNEPEGIKDFARKTGFILKDSGQREIMSTGAQRDIREGKGRFDLIPPHFLRRLADVYEKGAKKYTDNNWRKGMKLHLYIDSAYRHLNDWREGATDEDHVVQAIWNLISVLETEDMVRRGVLPNDLIDIGPYSSNAEGRVQEPLTNDKE